MRKISAKPEIWIAIHGFLLAFVWEMLQMPFYNTDNLSAWAVTTNCTLATFGDAGIMVFAYWATSKMTANRRWLRKRRMGPVAIYLGIGLAVTIAAEYIALTNEWGWNYSELMPTVANIGLVPIMMWIIVPILTLALARQSLFGSKPGAGG